MDLDLLDSEVVKMDKWHFVITKVNKESFMKYGFLYPKGYWEKGGYVIFYCREFGFWISKSEDITEEEWILFHKELNGEEIRKLNFNKRKGEVALVNYLKQLGVPDKFFRW